MKAQFINVTEAEKQYKWFAAQDAMRRATNMWSHYSYAQKLQAQRMVLGLELAYSAKIYEPNPRQKFISIKLENARVRDRAVLKELEEQYEKQGVTKIVTPQGVTYRIPKQ